MEFVSSLHSTMPSLPTQDVLLGIGTTKYALAVQKTGHSMLIKFAFPSVIFVLSIKTDSVPHAIKDTT